MPEPSQSPQVEKDMEKEKAPGCLPEPETCLSPAPAPAPQKKIAREEFAKLPEIPIGEAYDLLHSGEAIRGKKIPFLNLDRRTMEKDIVIEDCELQGMVGRAASFKKIILRNTLVLERLNWSAQKEEEGKIPTVVKEDLILEDCIIEDSLTLRGTEVQGEFRLTRCNILGPIVLDRSIFDKKIVWEGPGAFPNASFYNTKLSGIAIENYEIGEAKDNSLDFNCARVSHTLSVKGSHLAGDFLLKRARLEGEYEHPALLIENCSLRNLIFCESLTKGDSQIAATQFLGGIVASTPREKNGQIAGRSVVWHGDFAFWDCTFGALCAFHGARFRKYLNIKNCIFEKGADFNQAEFAQLCSFWEVTDKGGLHFRKAAFQGRAQFGRVTFAAKTSFNEATCDEEMSIFESTVAGDLFFSGASFARDFKLKNLKIEGGLNLQKMVVEGSLKITNAAIHDRFILTETQITGAFIAPALHIGTWGSISKTNIKNEVELSGLAVGIHLGEEEKKATTDFIPGSFYCEEAIFHHNFSLSRAEIPGKLDLQGVKIQGESDLTSMNIGNDLLLSKSYFRGMVQLAGTRCANLLDSFKTRYKEEASFNAIRCRKCTLAESSFDGGFTMRGAQIEESLILNNVDVDGKVDLIKCSFGDLYFFNFLVDHLLIRRQQLGACISSERQKNYVQAKNEYGILKEAFRGSNHFEDMDWAYYRFCQCSRKDKKTPGRWRKATGFFEWLFLDLGFGYGTRPMNIALVALGLIVFFATAFYLVPQSISDKSGPLPYLSISDAFYLSTMTFASIDYGECWPSFQHGFKHLFALEGILGIFMVTLFVATVARKIIRA